MNELQQEDFNVLKELDVFLKEEKLPYVVHSGTLLGTLRHQGFIPWDDDLDIAMMRNVYGNFEKKIKSSDLLKRGYVYQSDHQSKDYAFPFAKFRSNRLNISEDISKTQHGFVGPWVDIFPLDNIPDSIDDRKKQFKDVAFYNRLISLFLLVKVKDTDKGVKRVVKKMMQKINETFYKYYFFIPYFYKKRLYHMTKYNGQETKEVGMLSYHKYKNYDEYAQTIMKREWVETVQYAEFEGLTVPIPNNSEVVLTNLYGDYMKLPPVEERKVHQINYYSS